MKSFCILLLLFFSASILAQDTVRIENITAPILHSWWPEHMPNPELKVGEWKLLFIKAPSFWVRGLYRNRQCLSTNVMNVSIKESEHKNGQFSVRVPESLDHLNEIEFELWLDIEDDVILIRRNSKWVDIRKIYRTENNRVLINSVMLKVRHR